MPVGAYALEGSMIGFETAQLAQVVVRADQVTEITLALEEAPATLGEIIVTPGYFSMMHRRPAVHQTLTRAEIRDMPHLADDIYRTVTRLPGVSGNDFFAGFTVRGGSHEEVLVQLDGMELYEPFPPQERLRWRPDEHHRQRNRRRHGVDDGSLPRRIRQPAQRRVQHRIVAAARREDPDVAGSEFYQCAPALRRIVSTGTRRVARRGAPGLRGPAAHARQGR